LEGVLLLTAGVLDGHPIAIDAQRGDGGAVDVEVLHFKKVV